MLLKEFHIQEIQRREASYFKVWNKDVLNATRKPPASYVNDDEDDVDAAIEMLNGYIDAQPGSVFTVAMSHRMNPRNDDVTYWFTVKKSKQQRDHISGTIPSIYGGNVQAYIQEQVDTKLALRSMEDEIDALRNAKEENKGLKERIFDILDNPDGKNTVLSQLVNGILGIAQTLAVQKFSNGTISLQGIPVPKNDNPKTEVPNPSSEVSEKTEVPNPSAEVSGRNSIEKSIDRLEKIFPDVESLLESLADFAEQNPVMAKNLLTQITSK